MLGYRSVKTEIYKGKDEQGDGGVLEIMVLDNDSQELSLSLENRRLRKGILLVLK